MSQSTMSFGPEWMRSNKKSTDKSSLPWSGIAAAGGVTEPLNSSEPSTETQIPSQPVLSNSGGQKYSAGEMLEIWQQMKDKNQFRTSGRARPDLYYSVMPNQPANILASEKKDDTSTLAPASNTNTTSMASEFFSSTTTTAPAPAPAQTTGPWGSSSSTVGPGVGPGATLFENVSTPTATPPPPPPPPPGISNLIPPESVNWYYKDPSGNEYGPFNGRMMHEWYVAGYLQETLLLRRAEEREYASLKSFKEKVNNSSEPFLVPLPPLGADFRPPNDPFGRLRQQMPLANQFGSLSIQPGAAWGMGMPPGPGPAPVAVSSPMANSPMSPWGHASVLFPQQSPQQQQQQQQPPPQPQSSIFGGLQEQPQPTNVWNASPSTVSAQLQQQQQQQPPAPPAPIQSPARSVKEPTPEPTQNVAEPEPQQQPEPEPEVKEEEPVAVAPPAPAEEPQPESQAPPQQAPATPTPTQVESPQISTASPVDASPVVEDTKPPKPPALAPWANKAQTPEKKPSAPSLKEIQEREAAERKSRLTQQQQQQQANVLQQAAALQSAAAKSNAPKLPSAATWASAGSSQGAAPKTLAEIQQEEAAAAAAKKKNTPPSSVPKASSYAGIAAPGGLAVKTSSATAASVASTASAGGSGWTTVGPGGRKVSAATGATPSPPTAASPSTTAPIRRTVTPSAVPVAKKSAGDEFLNWCKTSMTDLNSGVNQHEMLSMLLSLPANSDSKEIIADTIYANSKTMDGRRFADEFIKRRAQADKESPSNGESWSDVLQRQANTVNKPSNDGWNTSFKVVTKKKGRKP